MALMGYMHRQFRWPVDEIAHKLHRHARARISGIDQTPQISYEPSAAARDSGSPNQSWRS